MRYRFRTPHPSAREFVLDTARELLLTADGARVLRRQAFAVLCLLVQRAPNLVGIAELLDTVWRRRAVSPSALPQAIRVLRHALGDPASMPGCIETRHRRGYRFIAAVTLETTSAASDDALLMLASPPQALAARLHVSARHAANDTIDARTVRSALRGEPRSLVRE
jgi:DNA-binding winged helix-turn-helix (wHTH) protein